MLSDSSATSWLQLVALVETFVDLYEHVRLVCSSYKSYSLNCLKGAIKGIIQETTIRVIKGDNKSLDYSSYSRLPSRNSGRPHCKWQWHKLYNDGGTPQARKGKPQHRKPEAPSKGSECFVLDTLRTFMGSDVSTLWVRKSHPFANSDP